MNRTKHGKSFVRTVLAWIAISIVCCMYLECEMKWVGTILFAVGLMTVIAFKLDLYTGKVKYIVENQPSYLWYIPAIISGTS